MARRFNHILIIAVLGLVLSACTPFVRLPATSQFTTHHWLAVLQQDSVQVTQLGDYVRIIIPADRLFGYDDISLEADYYIDPDSVSVLVHVAEFIKMYGKVYVTVTGYSDTVPSIPEGHLLAERRAKSVLAFLWSHGIPYTRLRVRSYGHSFPISTNQNPLGSYNNRRIEITFKANYGVDGCAKQCVEEGYG